MFITKPKNATILRKRSSDYYDDGTTSSEAIKVVPYNVDMAIRFGIVTIPEATGYFITPLIDAKEGDQIEYQGHKYTILKVSDLWQFNKITNLVIGVK